MKSNRDKNKEHDLKEQQRVRPKQPIYEFDELEKIVNSWIRTRLENE